MQRLLYETDQARHALWRACVDSGCGYEKYVDALRWCTGRYKEPSEGYMRCLLEIADHIREGRF